MSTKLRRERRVTRLCRFPPHICCRCRFSDIYEKKDGALDFVARETQVFNQANVLVAELRSVLVHRNR